MALARRRLAKANHERERLLQAYLADALPLDVLKREQKRVAKVIGLAEQEISRAEAADSPYRELLEFAVSLIRDAQERYSGADPYGKRLWNQSLLERVEVKSGQITRVELKPPFEDLLLFASSNKGSLVGEAGFEPATPWPPAKCAAGLRYSPIQGPSLPGRSVFGPRLGGGPTEPRRRRAGR